MTKQNLTHRITTPIQILATDKLLSSRFGEVAPLKYWMLKIYLNTNTWNHKFKYTCKNWSNILSNWILCPNIQSELCIASSDGFFRLSWLSSFYKQEKQENNINIANMQQDQLPPSVQYTVNQQCSCMEAFLALLSFALQPQF